MIDTAGQREDGGFLELGLDEGLVRTLSELGYEEPTPIQREAIPASARGPRPARPGRDRHRQDGGVRASDPAARSPRYRKTSASVPSAVILVPTRELAMQVAEAVHRYGKSLGVRTCCRSTAGSRCSSSCARSGAASTSSSRRLAACSTTSGGGASTSARCARSSSTRPTRCSTWGSPRTSRRSSPRCRASARRRSSRPRSRRGSRRSRKTHLQDPVRITIARESAADRREAARARGRLRRGEAAQDRKRSGGCSTWRVPPRRSCSAARARKSTS